MAQDYSSSYGVSQASQMLYIHALGRIVSLWTNFIKLMNVYFCLLLECEQSLSFSPFQLTCISHAAGAMRDLLHEVYCLPPFAVRLGYF